MLFCRNKNQLVLWVVSLFLLCPLILVSPASGEEAVTGELTWTGCSITQKAFMAEIAQAYEKKTGIKVRLSGGGATKGIREVAAGMADMGGTCRHWLGGLGKEHPQEKGAALIQVAWDALVVIVHPSNPVDSISLPELKKVFNGELTSWRDLGGEESPIAVVTREGKDSGVGHMFRLMVLNDPNYEYRFHSLKAKDSAPLENMVEKIPTATGIDGVSSAVRRQVKILALDGVAPTKENIGSGRYPLFRPLYISVGRKVTAQVQKLIDFILSPEGQAIISQQGTVNLEEGRPLIPLWAAKKSGYGL